MNSEEFKNASVDMTSFITNYLDNIRERSVLPEVSPGYVRPLVPESAPDVPEKWDDIMKDIERVIMPGMTHWNSPRFHAYFPTANSYPAILADMLCGALGCIGFSWIASPACTELETVMMDWLAELLGLPEQFFFKSKLGGGGIIQGTASEATLVALLAAKAKKLKELQIKLPSATNLTSSLVAYSSDQSHSSVERAGMLGGVKMRLLPSDSNGAMRGDVLKAAIEEDLRKGLYPFYVVATLGTTNMCNFDNLEEIGSVGNENDLWVHVDAAYAGSAFVCEEFRYLMKGVDLVDSFNFNPHKWLLVNFDCSAMWVKNSNLLEGAFNVDPLYLKHEHQGSVIPDYRHWQIPLGRRFRSLKLWFVMRLYGKIGLQEHIRFQISMAKEFEKLVLEDTRFEVVGQVIMGLVCFRLKGSNSINEKLLKDINDAREIHLVPSKVKGTYFLRFAVCSRFTNSVDVKFSWNEILKHI